jgi:coniferyl-aldehyde dehydrogenase
MNVHVEAASLEAASHLDLASILESQRAAFLRDGAPSYEVRIANLAKLRKAILAHRKDIEAAIHADFGNRSAYETALMEIMPIVGGIDYLRKHLRGWMRPKARHVALQFRPGTAKILTQPLGVIGIIAPWNYPASLSLIPLATALAAGNRAMIKPSEYTPRTSALLASLVGGLFSADEVAVVTGGPEVAAAFSELAFDHLLFTGSTSIGRSVMQAASKNLVPVTLELGGKSPVIVDQGFDAAKAAKSIVFGKLSNAGQTCIAPDYALVHETDLDAFVAAFTAAARDAYPAGTSDAAYGSIISQRHYDRLVGLVADSREKGAKIVEINTAPGATRPRTIAPTLILGATPEMKVMQEEIFGPILPVLPYRAIEETIARVNAGPRPLALYVFSDKTDVINDILARTTSGNVTVNDTLLHCAVDDLPFGGIGASGMGAYHGEEGFRAFSHSKGVFTQSKWHLTGTVRAPFGRVADLLLAALLR